MTKYRVRWAEYPDGHCKDIEAVSPQHAAEIFVETCDREMSDGDEFEVVAIEGEKRHNILVRVRLSFHFEARKPRDLQKEKW
jgi:hypothetical protein